MEGLNFEMATLVGAKSVNGPFWRNTCVSPADVMAEMGVLQCE
jgi:hypothetical protein